MNVEELREYCIAKSGVTECMPFDDSTLVFKLENKIFALISLESTDLSINLKCEPDLAIDLRNRFKGVLPGYHMNKKHWNTIKINEINNDKLVKQWIDNSYNLILQSLPKKLKEKYIND